jgi:hypothetical protein
MCWLRRLLVFLAVTVTVGLSASSVASAQPYYGPGYGPPPGYRAPGYGRPYYGYNTHDGFFMRLNVGFGYLTASESYAGATDTYSGLGFNYGAAFGGVIAPNLVLYGELFGMTVTDPNYSISNGGGSQNLSGVDMTAFGIGPGIAYYFMPINAFVSGTLVLTKMYFTDSSSNVSLGDSDFGFGLSVMGGKEWWVSRDWGLGIAGQLYFGTMSDHPTYYGVSYDTRLDAFAFSVLFSATYN